MTLEQLECSREQGRVDEALRPIASTVGQWPPVELNGAPAFYLKQGQPVLVPHLPTTGWVRLYEGATERATVADRRFIGVGEILDDGRVAPRRLIVG